MAAPALILWGHALTALLFGMLAMSQMTTPAAPMPRAPFVTALATTALWALAVAGIDALDVAAGVVESLRNIAWLWFLFALIRDRAESRMIATTYTVVGLVSAAAALLAISEAAMGGTMAASVFAMPRTLLRLMAAVASLVLVHRVYVAVAPGARGGIRLALGALAAMWSVDLVLFSTAYVTGAAPAWLFAMRGLGMVALVPLWAVALHRDGDWSLQLSRTVAFGSLSLMGIAAYALVMTLGAGAFAAMGGSYARLFQTAFIAGTGTTLLAVVATPWLRAWLRVKVAKHLFRHRYDYRHEWLRFTATLGLSDSAAAPLDTRIAKAIADLTDSPGALLLVPESDGLGVGAAWNWDAPTGTVSPAFARSMSADGRIVELDAMRHDGGDGPQWLIDDSDAWAIVPLLHLGKLVGAVILSRPPVARALDWEDFDLLRVTASQAASYREQARAHAALAEAQRFDEFNRRFAFIMHDVKNLVSQLTLVARNAERHADNPDFRADMVATLQDSCERMNELLARLSQHHGGRADPVRPTELLPIAEGVAQRRRMQHPVVVTGDPAIMAAADPARLEQILHHLVQNAIEASTATDPVTIAISEDAQEVTIAVIDQGCGMSHAFVRDLLFRPFTSSKPGGFGIGAFEARQLAEAMGARIAVASREGQGTRFTLHLPHAIALEAAA